MRFKAVDDPCIPQKLCSAVLCEDIYKMLDALGLVSFCKNGSSSSPPIRISHDVVEKYVKPFLNGSGYDLY